MKTSLPKATIIKKTIKDNGRVKTFITEAKVKAKPGQFILVWLPRLAERPFAVVDDQPLTFTVCRVGNFTKRLYELKAGDKIWYRGPFGKGVFKKKGKKHLLVGGGYGVAPLYFLAKRLLNGSKPLVIIGARSKKELLFKDKFKKLGLKVLVSTDDGSQGEKGLVSDLLARLVDQKSFDCVYACGPKRMMKKVAGLCEKQKIVCQLSLEAMVKCGFGICGSCARYGRLICKDGPVFENMSKDEF